jgi:hypothetical protein
VSTSKLLEPYRPQMRDARHWELTCRLLDWSLPYLRREEPSVVARRAYVSSTFEVYCCPPEATLEEHLLGGKFIVCFFTADDGPDEALSSFLAAAEGPQASTELRGCHDAWLEALHREGRDTQGPRAAFREACEWIQVERGLDLSTMTEERFRQIRLYAIALPAYVACWKSIRALRPSERADEALRRSGLLELTSELVYMANDLGSLERDEEAARRQQPDAEMNLVLLRARALGSRQAAVQQVVAQYHEKLQDFRRLRAQLVGTEHWRERSVRDCVEQLRRAVNGNVATTRHLMATRYPGAHELLEGLPEVEPLPSWR